MEGKKISFGFMKTKKVQKPVAEEKKEFVECMEEKSIKVIGGEEVKEITPLVIPMKPNTLITAERLKQIAAEVESGLIEPETIVKSEPPEPTNVPENETLDQMAIRELMQDAKKEIKTECNELIVPVPSKPVIEGQKESTLDDYEEVPIQEFGMALLRGMGWTPTKEASKYKQPQLRPKGLGLGADKVISENQKKKTAINEKGEELSIVKNSYVKITSGKYNGYYGKVLSLDEENGRVMVDIAVKKETVSLSEFMMQPVTKAEYDKESKVIKRICNRPTTSQLEGLVEFLERNPGLAEGLLRTAQGKQENKLKWAKVATSLNALGGVTKDGPGWAKYWSEKKFSLKKMCAQNAVALRENGHSTKLSELDQRLVAAMGGSCFASGDQEVAVYVIPQTHYISETAKTLSTSSGGSEFHIKDVVSLSLPQPQESNTEAIETTPADTNTTPPQSDSTPNKRRRFRRRLSSNVVSAMERMAKIEERRVETERISAQTLADTNKKLDKLADATENIAVAITAVANALQLIANNLAR